MISLLADVTRHLTVATLSFLPNPHDSIKPSDYDAMMKVESFELY
jgi:hypothetical protein